MTVLDDRLSEFSDYVQDKAADLVAKKDQIRRDAEHPSVFWIREKYRVQVAEDGQCMCTCPHGMNNTPAHCYHAASALILLQEAGEDLEAAPTQAEEVVEDDEPDFVDVDDADEILDLSDANHLEG